MQLAKHPINKLGLQYKATLLIFTVLLLIGIAGGSLLLWTEYYSGVVNFRQSAMTIASVTWQQLKMDMITVNRQHIQSDLNNLVSTNGTNIKAVVILSNTQSVYASTDPAYIGKTVNWPLVTAALESQQPQAGDSQSDRNLLVVVLPIKNESECFNCHNPQVDVLGAIKVHVDKTPLAAQIWQQIQIMVIIGIVTFLLIGGVLAYILRRAVIKPMTKELDETIAGQEQLILTDRMASIGELASGVAHELNNPLTSIIGFSDLLLEKEMPADIKDDLKLINREAQRTAQIVKNLLTFARKHPPAKQPVDVNAAIRTVLSLRAYEQKVNNIQLVTNLAEDLPLVMADNFRLQQAFLNIIINAEFFMHQAHGKGTLTITTKKAGAGIRISFADDGPGIPHENMGHIFDPFFTTKEVGKGTGLGLSICHGIVTEHSGRIWAESELGKGATFFIELPVEVKNKGT